MYILLASSILVAVLMLLPRRRDFLSACEYLVRQMPATHYEDLCEYVDESTLRAADKAFWSKSEGATGLLQRLRISYYCLRLVQACRREGRVDAAESRVIWEKIIWQTVYTGFALIEAAACEMLTGLHHVAAQESLRYYCALVIRTNALCVTEDAPECLFRLPELL